ncbi:MAG: hypothetical protein JW940_16450 [Polyangiaceae bacterium]|nr:hypothetical protein [Polyangiaceae bacterium]
MRFAGVDPAASVTHLPPGVCCFSPAVVDPLLLRIGGGSPIAFTENGVMPDIGTLGSSQPKWVYWATWWGFEGSDIGNTNQLYSRVYGSERTLTQDEVQLGGCPQLGGRNPAYCEASLAR